MQQYIKNILPRIKQYSKQLSQVEVFVDKSWIFIDEKNNTHEYIFMRDKRFIMSMSGRVVTGSWDLLPNGKLLINRVADEIMLQYDFVDEAVMIMRKSGTGDTPFLLVNEDIIKDRNVVNYLESVEAKKIGFDIYKTKNGIRVNNRNSSTGSFEIGATIKPDNGILFNGELISLSKPGLFIYLFNGVIQFKYYKNSYKTRYGFDLIIHTKREKEIEVGDQIINNELLPSDVLERPFINQDKYRKVFVDSKGKITRIIDGPDEDAGTFLKVFSILICCFSVVFFIIRVIDYYKEPAPIVNEVIKDSIIDSVNTVVDSTIAIADTTAPNVANSSSTNPQNYDLDLFGLVSNGSYDLTGTNYYQIIFDKLRYVSTNNSSSLDMYIKRAKEILDSRTIVKFLNEEKNMYDFLDDESVRDRVNNVYLVTKNSNNSYTIYLTLFHQ